VRRAVSGNRFRAACKIFAPKIDTNEINGLRDAEIKGKKVRSRRRDVLSVPRSMPASGQDPPEAFIAD